MMIMERPGFYFLVCPDAEYSKERRADLLSKYAQPDRDYKLSVHWADDGLDRNFWDALTLPDLFGGVIILVLRRAELLSEMDWKQLGSALCSFKECCFPIFCLETPFEKAGPALPKDLTKRKIWEFANSRKWVWQSAGLTQVGLIQLLKKWAADLEMVFEPGALEHLASALPLDLASLRGELAKLELALPKGARIAASAADMVTASGGSDVFSFLSSLQKGAAPLKVWSDMFGYAGDRSVLFNFLGLIARDARQLWAILAGDKNIYLPPYVLAAKTSLAKSMGMAGVARIFDLALEAEMGVKSGKHTPDQALELLLAGLLDLFPGRGRKQQAA